MFKNFANISRLVRDTRKFSRHSHECRAKVRDKIRKTVARNSHASEILALTNVRVYWEVLASSPKGNDRSPKDQQVKTSSVVETFAHEDFHIMGIYFRRSKAVNFIVKGLIWPKFELIHDFVVLLVHTAKNGGIQIKKKLPMLPHSLAHLSPEPLGLHGEPIG